MAQKVYLKKSAVVDKTPSASNLEFGELAINYASGSGKSFLAAEKYDGSIAKFHEDTYNEAKYASKTAYESYTATTDSAIATAKDTAVSAFTYASAISATVKSTYWTSATTKSKIDEAKNAAVTSAYNASVASAKAYTDGLADFVKTYSSTTDSTLATLKSSATTLSGWVTDLYSKVGNYATHDEVKNASGNAITSAVSKAITSAKSYVDTNFVDKTTYTGYTATTNSSIATAQGTADAISATVRSGYWTSAETKTKIDAAVTSAYNASTAYTYGQIEALNLGQYATSAQLETTNSNLSTLSGEVVTIKGNYATKSFVGSASGYAYTQAKSDVIGQSTDNKDANTIYGAKAYASSLTKTLSGNVVTYVDGKVTTINSDISAVKTSAFTLSASVVSLSGAVNTKLSSVFKYKGTVASCSNLPNNAETGDTYNVVAASGNTPAGTNWTWSGERWDPLAGTVDLSGYVTAETYNGYTGATDSTLSDHGNKIEKLTTNSGSMQNQITQLTTNSGSLQNQVTKLSSNSGVMQNQIDKLIENSGSMYTTLTGVTGSITTLQSATGDLTNKVTQLITNSGSLQNQITKLEANSGAMHNQIAKLEANSGSLQNQVTKLAENSASMYTTLTGATGDITTLKSNTATMDTTLTKVNSSYVSAVTISTTGTVATIASNKLTIPVVNNNAALAFGESKTIATIGGVNVTASLPEGGHQGPQGPKGSQGPQGPAGANGTNGTNGTDGAQGRQGPQGTKGDQGPQGPTGAQGPNGQNGNDATGVQGPQGPAGANGTNGANGNQGPQGPQGIRGTKVGVVSSATFVSQGEVSIDPNGETYEIGDKVICIQYYSGYGTAIGALEIIGTSGTNYTAKIMAVGDCKDGAQGYQGAQGRQGPIGQDGYYIKQTAALTGKAESVWIGTTGSNSGVGKTVIQTFSAGHGLRVNDYFTLYGTDTTFGNGHLNIVRVTATANTRVTGTTVSAVEAYAGADGYQGPQGPKGSDGTNATGVQGPQGPKGAQGPAAEGSSLSLTTSNSGNHYLIGCNATSTAATTLSSSNTHRAGAATGSGIYWTGWNLYASSDERLKDFYDDVEVDLDKIKTLPKKYFRWKDKEVDGSKMNIGTSAQKLRELYPELVSGEDDGTLGVCYEKLSVVALAAVDKLHEENVVLKKEVEELKSRLDKIEGQLGI